MNTTGPVMLVYEHVGTVVVLHDYKGGPCVHQSLLVLLCLPNHFGYLKKMVRVTEYLQLDSLQEYTTRFPADFASVCSILCVSVTGPL